ncbi:MAG TPA: DUF427 domain-containing protein [Rubrobacteraceae bacterium]|nr:DUF427 domain-containing protein [Rubrobacteraceae bacterium]
MGRSCVEPGPGQESVWDYPRPPRMEDSDKRVEIVFGGVRIADTTRAKRVLETSHPPVYYVPEADVRVEHLRLAGGASFCEWKGAARYYDVSAGGRTERRAVWFYPHPVPAYADLKDHLAFYPSRMDACYVAGERVRSQEGDFYGGWITGDVVGPFKGAPGTRGW